MFQKEETGENMQENFPGLTDMNFQTEGRHFRMTKSK